MSKIRLVPALAVTLILASCAHHRDVRRGEGGIHRVVVRNEDKHAGSQDAIAQANHFCEQTKKSAAFLEEEQKYTGDVDESTYKTGKAASKVAKVVGGAAWTLGGRNESNAGGVIGLGGVAGDAVLGEGYTVSMKFKCE